MFKTTIENKSSLKWSISLKANFVCLKHFGIEVELRQNAGISDNN